MVPGLVNDRQQRRARIGALQVGAMAHRAMPAIHLRPMGTGALPAAGDVTVAPTFVAAGGGGEEHQTEDDHDP
jgi:hypothetical protein